MYCNGYVYISCILHYQRQASIHLQYLCYDSSNPGSATVVVGATGGTAPYVYKTSTGAYRTSNTFANLTPGTYTFEIRDANGCTDDITFTIEPQLTANVVLTKDIDCSLSPDAILDVTREWRIRAIYL